ncbi:MAG TPA: DUF1845 domain-containing protein, partial [Polyangiaceae bacterium]|nr:DUF1845 domain-containing protein [Polyangiaceae bacterium]
ANRAARRALQSALGYRYLAVTRDDVRQGTAKAARARELMGRVPQEVVDGEARAEHAPAPRRRRGRREEAEEAGAADGSRDDGTETPPRDPLAASEGGLRC